MAEDYRQWRTSPFGRSLGMMVGFSMLYLVLFVRPDEGWSNLWEEVLSTALLLLVGFIAVVGVWTSSLTLANGVLTARHFGLTRTMPLAEVDSLYAGWAPCTGLIIKAIDGRRIRTFVSGAGQYQAMSGRADRIADEIEALATAAREGV